MDEELFPPDKRPGEAEGVRIIGAEEAEKAIERDDVALAGEPLGDGVEIDHRSHGRLCE